ncbi:MAG: uroporphyrinogen decarboxylase family protein [Eubacteriales bacterium]|nr:uroporphyrinogen decarboxylase family protein [Eubacteriales bacterium]
MMTPKERLLAALRGQETDRVPYSPFLAYWWEMRSPEQRAQGMLEFMTQIGADPLLRGMAQAWKVTFPGTQQSSATRGNERCDTLSTPVGALKLVYQYSPSGDTWFLRDHPVAGVEDLKVLQWIYEHAQIEYDPAADAERERIGERGLLLPLVGSEMKTCFQSMVEKWAGTVQLTYLLADEPDAVEECLAAMRRISDQTAVLSAQSQCEGFIFWEDSSTTNISPSMFRTYTAQEITAWGNTLHQAGKLLIHHACGHVRALLPLMAQTPIDAVESISPPPTGNIDLDEAFALLPDHIGLIGGIEPVFLKDCTLPQLEQRVEFLKKTAAGRRFVLANSDSCPPEVQEEKLRALSHMV